MSTHKEESIRRNLVRAGIVDQRPLPNSKSKKGPQPWLTVRFAKGRRPSIFGDYSTEAEARKQMDKTLRYFPMYVVERSIFVQHYSSVRMLP